MNTFKLYPKQDFSTSFVKLFRNLVRNCQGSKIGKKGNSNSVWQTFESSVEVLRELRSLYKIYQMKFQT